MSKYSTSKLAEIEEWISEHGLIEYGGAKLKDFCKEMGINDKTYRNWLKKDDFKETIKRGREVFKTNLTNDLAASLAMVAKGYEREETETEYKPNATNPNLPHITKMKKKKVYFQPNVGAAIFLLTNLDPEHYQQRQRIDNVLKKDDKDMTLDEINAEIERLEKLDKQEET